MAEAEDRATAVAVGYVYSGKDVAYSWHHSVIELIGWDFAHEARILRGGYVAYKCGTDGLAGARNNAVKLFLAERQADWLFWVDTDMGFAPDTIDRLLEAADPAERPIVGGLAFTQQEAAADGMGGWRCRAAPTVFDWAVLDDGQMGFTIRWKYPPDALTRVGGTGSACVLIHRSVFERIEAKFGRCWYDRVPNTTTGQVLSEDLALCLRAGALDIPVHVHTGVKTTHQKTLWLAEDDYYGQVALSQMVPPVPAATEATAVIVPVLRRPGNAAPFMESLAASGAPLARVYAVADADDTETVVAWHEAGATVLTCDGRPPGTFAQKVNIGYRHTGEPWLLLTGDDVKFHPGWLDQAQHAARDGADVVGTNDLHNPRSAAGEWSPHLLVRRAYIDEQGASWDGPKILAHESYGHWFVDDELVTAAKQRGAWAMAFHARVEHLHPLFGLAEDDETYALGREHIEADKALFEKRLAEHAAPVKLGGLCCPPGRGPPRGQGSPSRQVPGAVSVADQGPFELPRPSPVLHPQELEQVRHVPEPALVDRAGDQLREFVRCPGAAVTSLLGEPVQDRRAAGLAGAIHAGALDVAVGLQLPHLPPHGAERRRTPRVPRPCLPPARPDGGEAAAERAAVTHASSPRLSRMLTAAASDTPLAFA